MFLASDFLLVLHGHLFFSSLPQRPMTYDFKGFLYQILSITLFSYLNSWERATFPFQCWVLNKWTTGTIFIKSLVWSGPWLGIEPGTSRTRCKHSTARLSRRQYLFFILDDNSCKILYVYYRWIVRQHIVHWCSSRGGCTSYSTACMCAVCTTAEKQTQGKLTNNSNTERCRRMCGFKEQNTIYASLIVTKPTLKDQ